MLGDGVGFGFGVTGRMWRWVGVEGDVAFIGVGEVFGSGWRAMVFREMLSLSGRGMAELATLRPSWSHDTRIVRWMFGVCVEV